MRRQNPDFRKRENDKTTMRNHTPEAKAKKKAKVLTDEQKAKMKARARILSAKSRSRPNGHDLYIMATDTFPWCYKVGRAADPDRRAIQMSAGFFDQYEVKKIYEGFGEHEILVHDALKPFMVSTPKKSKTEWFRLPYEELVEKINNVVSQFEH